MADPLPPADAEAVLATAEKDAAAKAAAEKAAANRAAALQYLAQAMSDYGNTLPPSVRGPFLREAQTAIDALKG